MDPLADKYVYNSPYAFSENHVTVHVELEGLEKVYIFDQAENPDNKRVYTGRAYVQSKEKGVQGPYRFSSFPNDDSKQNTVKDGTHKFNNKAGHHGGKQKGLNIVDDKGSRENTPGTDPSDNDKKMKWVNVHSGVDPENNGGKHNRGSAGCPTCHPSDAQEFFTNFKFENGNTGSAEGTVTIYRGDSEEATNTEKTLLFKIELQNTELGPISVPSDATKVNSKPRIP